MYNLYYSQYLNIAYILLQSELQQQIAKKLRSKNEEGLKVVSMDTKGRGVVSSRSFMKGELLCEYSGELISFKEAKRREMTYLLDPSIGCYMYYFNYKSSKLW